MSIKLSELLNVLGNESDKRFIRLFNSYDEFYKWQKKVYSIHQKLTDMDYRGLESPRITWKKYAGFMHEHLFYVNNISDIQISKVIEWYGPEDYPEDGYRKAYIKA